MPPRKQRSASRGSGAAKALPAAAQQDSAEATPVSAKDGRRAARQPVTPKAAKAPATPVAERVTRRSSRPSATKRPVYSDASESEEEVMPRKRDRSGRQISPRKATPAAKGGRGRGRPPTIAAKNTKKGKSPRKSRKRDSDDESEESLDLGESEEEAAPADDDDEEDEEEAVVATPKARGTAARSRGAGRGAARNVDDAAAAAAKASASKKSPSVLLERVEEGSAKSTRGTTRGRPSASASRSPRTAAKGVKRGGAGDSEDEEDDDEEEDEYSPAAAAAPTRGTSSRPRRAAPPSKPAATSNKQPPRRRTTATRKMVPSEEAAAAAAATDEDSSTDAKDDKVAALKDCKTADKGGADAREEDKPEDESSDKKGSGDTKEKKVDSDEAMDVDEPDKEKQVDQDGAAAKSDSPKKHKLDDAAAADESDLPPSKKARTEVSDSTAAAGDTTKSDDKTVTDAKASGDKPDGGTSSKVEEKKETEPESAAVNGSGDNKGAGAKPGVEEAKVNGDTVSSNEAAGESMMSASLGVALPRRCVASEGGVGIGKEDGFTVVSYNLACEDWSSKHASLVAEVVALRPSILCLQEVEEAYFKSSLDSALKGHGYMGLYKPGRTATKGLATFYLLAAFEILHHKELEVHDLLDKDVQASSLSESEKDAVKLFLHSPAPVLITKLKSISNGKSITVATIHLPSDDESLLAVQVSAVVRELLSVSEGASHPHVLCGSFNLGEGSPVQQLLKDGNLTSEVLDELKKKANVPVPEKENASLATLLATSFQHPSACLKSSYGSILGHEFKFPDKNQKLSRDSLWFSSDSLSTKSILDVGPPVESTATTPSGVHVSLKAELGFVN